MSRILSLRLIHAMQALTSTVVPSILDRIIIAQCAPYSFFMARQRLEKGTPINRVR